MLFIHGDDPDTFVQTWMVYPSEAKPEPKNYGLYPVPTCHVLQDYPQEYTEHVKKFVGKYIH